MDAFVYMDINGSETISFNELQLGFKRLGLTGVHAHVRACKNNQVPLVCSVRGSGRYV
jgi:hypothetical protein